LQGKEGRGNLADNVYMDLRMGHEQNRSRMVHSEVLLGLFIFFSYQTPNFRSRCKIANRN
jgi:hypothetical protein